MSNNYTAVVNLTKDPEELTLGERNLVKLRCADNSFGKNALPRYFDALVGGPDLDAAMRLKEGDQIVISGQLVKTGYKAKKGKNKGKTVEADSIPFAKLIQITRSESFFSGESGGDEPEGGDPEPSDGGGDEPGDEGADDPMADLV